MQESDIQLYLYQRSGKNVDITYFCKDINWSGTLTQVARKLTVNIKFPIFDTNQPSISVTEGDLLILFENGKELFQGIVFIANFDSSAEEISATAYDFSIYLAKSNGSFNFEKATPMEIVQEVCKKVGVSVGTLEPSKVKLKNRLYQARNLYEIIMDAYYQDTKETGVKYYHFMKGQNFNIEKKGKIVCNIILDNKAGIEGIKYSRSIENMINKIEIVDEKDNVKDSVENADDRSKYGTIMNVYKKEPDKDARQIATNMLKSIERKVDVNFLGYSDCITGKATILKISYISELKNVKMYIDNDTHTWSNRVHKMSLTLNYENEAVGGGSGG